MKKYSFIAYHWCKILINFGNYAQLIRLLVLNIIIFKKIQEKKENIQVKKKVKIAIT